MVNFSEARAIPPGRGITRAQLVWDASFIRLEGWLYTMSSGLYVGRNIHSEECDAQPLADALAFIDAGKEPRRPVYATPLAAALGGVREAFSYALDAVPMGEDAQLRAILDEQHKCAEDVRRSFTEASNGNTN